MDRERFDALARVLASTGSRRAALGALLGAGFLGTGLETDARNKKRRGRAGSKDRGKRNGKDRWKVSAEQIPANCCSTGNCTPGKAKSLGKCCYEGDDVSGKNFTSSDLGGANFSDATAIGANFRAANLGNACFVDANLTDAKFSASTNLQGAIFCRTTMPDGSTNDSGCAKGNRCCPTCDEDDPCDDGEVCCGGRCRSGDCCSNEDCEDPNEPVCIRFNCRACTTDGQCGGDLTCCAPICTDTDTDPDNCGECGRDCPEGDICSNGFTCQGEECLPVTEIENEVELAANGGLTLHAEPGGPPFVFGAFAFGVPNNTTFADIATMETDFDFTEGECGAGTPRFCVTFKNISSCACAQIPTNLCDDPGEAQGTSGNLIGNNTPGVWFKICSAAGPAIDSYSDALAGFGSEEIDSIFMVADSSNGNQTVTVRPCITLASP